MFINQVNLSNQVNFNPVKQEKSSNADISNSNGQQLSQGYNIAAYKNYNISFGAQGLKKSQLDNWDLACVEMFKAPIEKFSTKEDLHTWVKKELDKKMELSQYEQITDFDNAGKCSCFIIRCDRKFDAKQFNQRRMDTIKNWKAHVTEENEFLRDNPGAALIVFTAAVKGITDTNEVLPLRLHPKTVMDTLNEIQSNLGKDRKYKFNFSKVYDKKIRNVAVNADNTNEDISGWVRIPSKINDRKGFKANVAKLKSLSHDSWCTKHSMAKEYLASGDFHIYLEKGAPKLAVRCAGEKVVEVEDPQNNGNINDLGYKKILNEYVKHNCFDLSSNVKDAIEIEENANNPAQEDKHLPGACTQRQQARETARMILKAERAFQRLGDPKKILEYIGIKVTEDSDQPEKFILSDFAKTILPPSMKGAYVSFHDFDVDLEPITKNVIKIEGDVDLFHEGTYDFSSLEHIVGNANFGKAQDIILDSLDRIDGNAEFIDTRDIDISMLSYVGGKLTCGASRGFGSGFSDITDLGSLTYAKVLDIRNSKVNNLDALEHIGEVAHTDDGDFFPGQEEELKEYIRNRVHTDKPRK